MKHQNTIARPQSGGFWQGCDEVLYDARRAGPMIFDAYYPYIAKKLDIAPHLVLVIPGKQL